MTGSKDNPNQLLWMLGLALTLPMILLSGPLAGYFIGNALVNRLHWPGFLLPVLMGLGLLGSGLQSFQLIRKLMLSQQNADRQKDKP